MDEQMRKEKELLSNMSNIEDRIEQKLKEIDNMVFVTKPKDVKSPSPLVKAGLKQIETRKSIARDDGPTEVTPRSKGFTP